MAVGPSACFHSQGASSSSSSCSRIEAGALRHKIHRSPLSDRGESFQRFGIHCERRRADGPTHHSTRQSVRQRWVPAHANQSGANRLGAEPGSSGFAPARGSDHQTSSRLVRDSRICAQRFPTGNQSNSPCSWQVQGRSQKASLASGDVTTTRTTAGLGRGPD